MPPIRVLTTTAGVLPVPCCCCGRPTPLRIWDRCPSCWWLRR